MAVRFVTADGDLYLRTTSLPNADSFSACGFSVVNNFSNFAVQFELQSTTGPRWHALESSDSAGTNLFEYNDDSGTPTHVTIGTMTTGTPFFWGVTKNGSTVHCFYRNLTTNVVTQTNTTGGTGMTPSSIDLGGSNGYTSETIDGRISGVRVWAAVLSDAEMIQEAFTLRPRRLANLHGWWPMLAAVESDCRIDWSGNGRTWSVTNTPAQEQGAPIPWGAGPRLQGIGIGVTLVHVAPNDDISVGTWTPSTGGTLFGTIDETVAADGDYDVNVNSAGGVFEVALTGLRDPTASTNHSVSYRISGESGSLVVSLRQGTDTEIASWTHDAPLPASPTTYVQTLTGGQADSITDYADLRLRFQAALP